MVAGNRRARRATGRATNRKYRCKPAIRIAGAVLLASALQAPLAAPLSADIVPSARIEAQTTLPSLAGNGIADFAALARISLDSSKNDAIKGKVQFSLSESSPSSNALSVSLEQAWIRARFPWLDEDSSLRMTAGKAPLAWGRGFLYNAADPVFGAIPAVSAPGTGEYRTATEWLASAYVPLGDFSFAEFLALPQNGAGAGARMFITPALGAIHSLELNYLARESTARDSSSPAAHGAGRHTASFAADGSLFFDWYAAVSVAIPHSSLASGTLGTEDAKPQFSAGLFRMFSPPVIKSLSMRIETLYIPESADCIFRGAHSGTGAVFGYASLQAGLTDLWSIALQIIANRSFRSDSDSAAGIAGGAVAAPESTTGALTASFTPIKGFTVNASAIASDSPVRRFVSNGLIWSLGIQAAF